MGYLELKIRIGLIKPRYSKTVRESYPSFGCAFCDSIFGDYFVRKEMMKSEYHTERLLKIHIEIQGNIFATVNCRYKRD